MDKPWWRRLDGLPRGAERRRSQPLSARRVLATRLTIGVVLIVAVAFAVSGHWTAAVGLLATFLIATGLTAPVHHLRQVFGRA